MTTFHPFPRLPAELRLLIWALTTSPRTVEVRIHNDPRTDTATATTTATAGPSSQQQQNNLTLISSAPIPGPLQTCREARNAGIYHHVYPDLTNYYIKPGTEYAEERWYFWVNFDMDMISIGTTDLDFLVPVAHLVKRLRVQRDSLRGQWAYVEAEELLMFANVVEMHAVIRETGNMVDCTYRDRYLVLGRGFFEELRAFVEEVDGWNGLGGGR